MPAQALSTSPVCDVRNQKALASRRRTLHISELRPADMTPPEWTGTSSFMRAINPDVYSYQQSGALKSERDPRIVDKSTICSHQNLTKKNNPRRRSTGFEQLSQSRPSILITPVDAPPLPRPSPFSANAGIGEDVPHHTQGLTKGDNGNRLSANSSLQLKNHISKRSENNLRASNESHPGGRSSSRNSQRMSKSKFPVRDRSSIVQPAGQVETIQEKHERFRRERAAESRHRRKGEGGSLTMGTSTVLPSLSPFPTIVTPPPIHLRGSNGSAQLRLHSRSMNGLLGRTSSTVQLSGYRPNPPINKGMSNPSMPGATSNPSAPPSSAAKGRSRMISSHERIPLQLASSPSRSSSADRRHSQRITPRSPLQAQQTETKSAVERPSRFQEPSAQSRLHSKSASSLRSLASRVSTKSAKSQKSSKSTKHQKGVIKEDLDALATLTSPTPTANPEMTSESRALLASQEKKLEEKKRRESVASERAARRSFYAEKNRSREASRATSRATSRVRNETIDTESRVSLPLTSTTGTRVLNQNAMLEKEKIVAAVLGLALDEDGDILRGDSIQGLTPDSVRLLREKEKLVRWKAEREKEQFERKEREKERVRSANELEKERAGQVKKRRGCFGWLC